jgi:phage portal protein BeeE
MTNKLQRLALWLGLEAKASKTAKFIAWTSVGRPVWTPRDLGALAREGFAKNAVVYRSVRMIAEAAASVPLFLFDGERKVDEHALLRLLAKPNPMQCGPDLLEAWYGILWWPATPISKPYRWRARCASCMRSVPIA